MKYMLFFLFVVFFGQAKAQNLVPNWSFEDTIQCPFTDNQVHFSAGWSSFGNSSDYFNACDTGTVVLPLPMTGVPINAFGFQYAATGDAYCGLFTLGYSNSYREFIGRKLHKPLIESTRYYFSMKVSLADLSDCASNNLGVLFSTIPYDEINLSPIVNQAHVYTHEVITDSIDWIKISGTFIADSAYEYIIIGNFFDDLLTDTIMFSPAGCNPYYYIDDVCVLEDSTMSCDVDYTVSTVAHFQEQFDIFPNPAMEKIYFKMNEAVNITGSLVSVTGQKIKSFRFTGSGEIDVSNVSSGIYFFQLQYKNQHYFFKQLIY